MRRFAATGLVAIGLLLPPLTAVANEDPQPPAWPAIQTPDDGGGGSSDPQPASWPAVAKPDAGQAEDPPPPAWPAPVQG